MKRLFSTVCILGLAGCATGTRQTTLTTDARLQGGAEAKANLTVPAEWFQSKKEATKAEFTAPDNFSRVAFSVLPVTAPAESCPALAKRQADDQLAALVGKRDVKPTVSSPEPSTTDFTVTIPGTPAGPPLDRVWLGRSVCKDGSLALVTCSYGIKRDDMKGTCQKVLASLAVEGLVQNAGNPAPDMDRAKTLQKDEATRMEPQNAPVAAPVVSPQPGTPTNEQPPAAAPATPETPETPATPAAPTPPEAPATPPAK